MKIVAEASESAVWLRIFVALDLVTPLIARPMIQEADELAAIAIAPARTAAKPRRVQNE